MPLKERIICNKKETQHNTEAAHHVRQPSLHQPSAFCHSDKAHSAEEESAIPGRRHRCCLQKSRFLVAALLGMTIFEIKEKTTRAIEPSPGVAHLRLHARAEYSASFAMVRQLPRATDRRR